MSRERLLTKEQIEKVIEFSPSARFAAAQLGVSHQTLHSTIKEYWGCTYPELAAQKTGPWIQKMVKKGIQLGLEGNVHMLKFMLGQFAGMYEKHLMEVEGQTITLLYANDKPPEVVSRDSLQTIDISPSEDVEHDTKD